MAWCDRDSCGWIVTRYAEGTTVAPEKSEMEIKARCCGSTRPSKSCPAHDEATGRVMIAFTMKGGRSA
jgi:hypothetical protein